MPADSARTAADPLELLLAGTYPDPDGGPPITSPIGHIAIAESLDGAEAQLVADCGLGGRLAVVYDEDTEEALGDRVARALSASATVERIRLGSRPHADSDTLHALVRDLAPGTDGVVAVGSGTINDLCKLAALAIGRPQVVFATAPSMNGFSSVSASLVEGGVKRSIRAKAPVGVFCDLTVLAAAPPRLIRAGLGDSLCRVTAQRDWYLQHRLLDRPYREAPFALLANDERILMRDPHALISGDLTAMRALVRTLILSGLGMTLCDGSYPASQGEHLLAHYMEMTSAGHDASSFHGEQIGVTTLVMAALQQAILTCDRPPLLAPNALTESELVARWGPDVGSSCWTAIAGKRLDPQATDAANQRLEARWDELRLKLLDLGPDADALGAALRAAGAATTPEEVGWSRPRVADALRFAREIRDRYTFLDVAADSKLDLDGLL